MTKIDIIDPNNLSPENQKLISEISSDDKLLLLTMSTQSEEGVANVKKAVRIYRPTSVGYSLMVTGLRSFIRSKNTNEAKK